VPTPHGNRVPGELTMRVHAIHNKTFPGHEAFIPIQPLGSGNMFPVRHRRTAAGAQMPRNRPQPPRQHLQKHAHRESTPGPSGPGVDSRLPRLPSLLRPKP